MIWLFAYFFANSFSDEEKCQCLIEFKPQSRRRPYRIMTQYGCTVLAGPVRQATGDFSNAVPEGLSPQTWPTGTITAATTQITESQCRRLQCGQAAATTAPAKMVTETVATTTAASGRSSWTPKQHPHFVLRRAHDDDGDGGAVAGRPIENTLPILLTCTFFRQ